LGLRREKTDGFWVACGLVFLAGGMWELFGLTWPLASVLLILLGLSMLWNARPEVSRTEPDVT
jgi:membrane protein implicated in regulation of membrane protease activity